MEIIALIVVLILLPLLIVVTIIALELDWRDQEQDQEGDTSRRHSWFGFGGLRKWGDHDKRDDAEHR